MPSDTEASPGAGAQGEATVGVVATGRVRRHEFVYANDDRFAPTALVPAPPPRPVKPPAPVGELTTANAEEVASLVTEALGGAPDTRNHNRWGIRGLLTHLELYPGQTWQQRWESAGLNEPGATVTAQATTVSPTLRRRLNAAAGHAFAVRLVQPSLRAFRSYLFSCYPRWFRTIARDPLLEEFCRRVEALPVSRERHHDALSTCAARRPSSASSWPS
ncbi:hypothetical protein [Kutzneria sp. 744]|uniref:hypothetical protein n=1 Tax=Kutzneria sp. (strain 744) TaxID=345341 RepID=UPI0003EEAF38|nr:hypothetical protein [Kutzneria sp. 744]EWM15236.1 DNA integrase/recombinase [Kutzneria sp. 744]